MLDFSAQMVTPLPQLVLCLIYTSHSPIVQYFYTVQLLLQYSHCCLCYALVSDTIHNL